MNTIRRVLRFNIKVDSGVITLPSGPVVLVTPDRLFNGPGNLEVWIQATTDEHFPATATQGEQDILVIPTGVGIPDAAEHLASVINGPLVWHLYRLEPSAVDDLDAVVIPTAEDLEQARWVMAADLWEADPGKQTPARTFGEEYSHSQDRYLAMATAILAPEPVEPEAKR